MSIANKCNSLASASSFYSDPTIKLHALPLVEQDNVNVVTLNDTQFMRGKTSTRQLLQRHATCGKTHRLSF
jgi:hypothetical protein